LTAYEGVLNCYLIAAKILNSSFFEIDAMELETLLELLNVYNKVNGGYDRQVFIDDIL